MSEPNVDKDKGTDVRRQEAESKAKAPAKLRLSRKYKGRPIPISVKFFSGPLAEHEAVTFFFRMQLSKEALARRESWLGQTQAERTASVDEQILDEVADLSVAEPEGLEDWPEPEAGDGSGNVGQRLRAYIAEITDDDTKFLFRQILEAANNGYWAAVTPREFRQKV